MFISIFNKPSRRPFFSSCNSETFLCIFQAFICQSLSYILTAVILGKSLFDLRRRQPWKNWKNNINMAQNMAYSDITRLSRQLQTVSTIIVSQSRQLVDQFLKLISKSFKHSSYKSCTNWFLSTSEFFQQMISFTN